MILAVQYYRPPFPERTDWRRDLERIKATGIDAIQLWITWGWVESTPGTYDFVDYDELIRLAHATGLKIILSTIAEIHPFWIHRVIPDSRMVDHVGRPVRSVPRRENSVGLTPGGCTDHPEVRERMRAFLTACAEHFATAPGLVSWDVWNENRWAVHAPGHVCYCEYTLRAFRSWLAEQYRHIDGLNAAWRRRYVDWRDVNPGTVPALPFTDTVEFQRFLTWRAGRIMALRADAVRSGDPDHPVTAHGIAPAAFSPGQQFEQAVSRGNDWDHVEHLDGYGLSMYPDFFIEDDADFGARIEATRSACGAKPLWISELEAAPTGVGFLAGRPVTGADLRRWIWQCPGHGAGGIVLWQWYDERTGEESASFGLAGGDPNAADRLAALTSLNACRDRHAELLATYRPDDGQVGVVFDEGAYHLGWSQRGPDEDLFCGSVIGYLRALERLGVAYTVLDSRHLDDAHLQPLHLVICAAPLTMQSGLADVLARWVRAGGHLLVEPGLGSYDRTGFYHYPDDRDSARALSVAAGGREPLVGGEAVTATVGERRFSLHAHTWGERVRVGSAPVDAGSRWSTGPIGAGIVMTVGSFVGLGYYRDRYTEFEDFVGAVVELADAGGAIAVADSGRSVLVRSGVSGATRLLFCTNPGDHPVTITVRLPTGADALGDLCDIIAGEVPISDRLARVLVPARSTRVLVAHPGGAV